MFQKLIDFIDNVEFLLLRENIDHFDVVENLMDPNFILTKLMMRHLNEN